MLSSFETGLSNAALDILYIDYQRRWLMTSSDQSHNGL